jgi:hypothetical protein
MAEPRDIMTREEADETAQLIATIARNAARDEVREQQGAEKEYAWGVADPDADPLPIWVYRIDQACEPIDYVVTFDPDYAASGASVPLIYSLNNGSSWSAYGSAASVSGVIGTGSVAAAPDLPVGALITVGKSGLSGGGGLGLLAKLRVRRIGQHVGARRA